MATFKNRYLAKWAGKEISGYLYIDEKDYVGTSPSDDDSLRLVYDSISVNYMFGDWNDPIIGLQCEFELMNDKEDYFELLPLMTGAEGKYKVRLVVNDTDSSSTDTLLFEGFLNCDTNSQKYLRKQPIKLIASSYLSKLEDLHPDSVDELKNMTFIDVIDEILVSTGASFNILVNSKLHAEGDILVDNKQTLFNKNGFFTELFWTDEVERENSLNILRKILTTFDCYIYWQEGVWCIERYEDIWQETVSFCKYTTGTLYNSAALGTLVTVSRTKEEIAYNKLTKDGLQFTDTSQTLGTIPGLKSIQINLEDKRLLNLAKADLTNVEFTSAAAPTPGMRKWLNWYGNDWTWANAGKSKSVIGNSINRRNGGLLAIPFEYYKGLYTQFKVTVESATELNIKWKYAVERPTGVSSWEGYNFEFHYYLRCVADSDYIFNVPDTEDWLKQPSTEADAVQSIVVSGSNMDKTTNTVDVSISVPIGLVQNFFEDLQVGTISGDFSLVLCIGAEIITKQDEDDFQPVSAWFGDIQITTTGDSQNNVIEGKVSNDFLNKKTIDLLLYDSENVCYKNGILRGTTLEIRTEKWGTTGGSTEIKQRGICWATHTSPNLTDSFTIDGTGMGEFTSKLTGLTDGTTYYVRSYFIDGTDAVIYGDEKTFNTIDLEIGSEYRGGIIAYIYQPGDGPYVAGQIHGIIAAHEDVKLPGAYNQDYWCSLNHRSNNDVKCDTITGLGEVDPYQAGQTNTAAMLDNVFVEEFIAKYVDEYSFGGYTDWVIPSIDELYLLRVSKILIGRFGTDWYWSSSELDTNMPSNILAVIWAELLLVFGTNKQKQAWALNFGNLSAPETWKKNNLMRVRPIRYF